VLVEHRGDLPPEVNPAQRDLPAAAGLARFLLARHAPVVLGRLADRQYSLANLRRLLENCRPATWA